MFEQLGLIGCGLMGGSFALALKRAGLVKRVVGYSKSPSTTERARLMGVIDVEAPSALLAVSGADIVLIAVPVAATEATFKAIKHLVTDNMLIMDVGSTKRDVIDAGRRALREQIGSFVPAHPITGKEVSGVDNADPDLYTGRQVILTPIERTLTVQLQKAVDVWTALGCRVLKMSPEAARRGVCRGQPPAAPDRICPDECHLRPTPGQRLPVAGRPRLSRFHPHRRQRPQGVARHFGVQPRRAAGPVQDFSAQPARPGVDDFQWQHRGARRPAGTGQHHPRQLEHDVPTQPLMFSTAFLDLPPLGGAGGTVTLPGSKSISNRVLLLAALCKGTTTVHDLLDSDDTRVMLDALRVLGCGMRQDGTTVRN